jgi:cytochrome c oxidase subunit 4
MSGKHHIISIETYLKVFAALIVLTVVTVWVAQFDFGHLNAFVALLIASVKASVVMLWFMHLKYEDKINQVIFGSAFFFLLLFLALAALDEFTRIAQTSTL